MTSTWTFTCSSCGRIERRKLSDQVAYFDDNIISMKKWKRARSANCRPF